MTSAFARLLETLRPDLVRFAFWLARDRAVAEDVVQETLIRAWKSRDELKDSAAARPWLLTIVRREHARSMSASGCRRWTWKPWKIGRSGAGQRRRCRPRGSRRAIMQLPDEYREPLVLQVLGGFTTSEIAADSAHAGRGAHATVPRT